jgi:hypothetical protein
MELVDIEVHRFGFRAAVVIAEAVGGIRVGSRAECGLNRILTHARSFGVGNRTLDGKGNPPTGKSPDREISRGFEPARL